MAAVEDGKKTIALDYQSIVIKKRIIYHSERGVQIGGLYL